MNKIVGILLVGLSLLTSAIVISLGGISKAIKEAASGNFGISSSALGEVYGIVYIIIIITVCLGIYSFTNKSREWFISQFYNLK